MMWKYISSRVGYGGSRGAIQIEIALSSPAIDINPVGNQISRYAATSVGVRKWDLGDGFQSSIFSRSVHTTCGV